MVLQIVIINYNYYKFSLDYDSEISYKICQYLMKLRRTKKSVGLLPGSVQSSKTLMLLLNHSIDHNFYFDSLQGNPKSKIRYHH